MLAATSSASPFTPLRAAVLLIAATSTSASLWTALARDDATHGPAPRLGAATLTLPVPGAGVAIAGGCSSSCCYAPLSDLWAFSGGAWANVSQLGAALPSARLYHAAAPAASPGDSFVFGGNDVENGPLGDLWLVTLSPAPPFTATWAQLSPAGAAPEARSSHTMNALADPSDGSFVLFGGETDAATLSDVWTFTPSAAAAGEGSGGVWAKVGVTGAASPGERAQHASVVAHLQSPGGRAVRALVVSGGVDVNGNDADDVWLLALDAKPPAWLLIGSSGAAGPSPRHGHALWTIVPEAAALGASTAAAAAAATVTLGLFGGQNSSISSPSNFHADTWAFTVDLVAGDDGSVQLSGGQAGSFTLLDDGAGGGGPSGTSPGPRALGCAAQSAGGALVFAAGFSGYTGGTDDRLHNDVWVANASASALRGAA